MAASHSFAGEHVEGGSGKEADTDYEENDIEHGDGLKNQPRREPSTWPHRDRARTVRVRSVERSSAASRIKVLEASTLIGISKPSRPCELTSVAGRCFR